MNHNIGTIVQFEETKDMKFVAAEESGSNGCEGCFFEKMLGCPLNKQCKEDHVIYQPMSDSMKRVYISGAIAHYDMSERKAAFKKAERDLAEMGFYPVNPFNNGLPEEAHWREHMRADIALLVTCDYIYMLKDWELSKGAKLEHDVATSCGIKVLKYE